MVLKKLEKKPIKNPISRPAPKTVHSMDPTVQKPIAKATPRPTINSTTQKPTSTFTQQKPLQSKQPEKKDQNFSQQMQEFYSNLNDNEKLAWLAIIIGALLIIISIILFIL